MTLHDRLARGRVTAGGRDYPVPGGMLQNAENLRREYGIPRAEQDQVALNSHRRAVAAQRSGVVAEEIVPVTTHKGEDVIDTVEQDPEVTVTTGNASEQNEAVAMCLVTHPQRADALALRPFVRLVS